MTAADGDTITITAHDVACPIARATDLIGDWWSPLVMREAFYGRRRFDEFQSSLEIPRAVLTARLKRLCDEGMLQRVEYQQSPPRYEYRLTDKGFGLFPVIIAVAEWGDRHYADDDGPPVEFAHRDCGAPVAVTVRCTDGHEITQPRDVVTRPGPGIRPFDA